MIKRRFLSELDEAFETHSIVGLLGPRQCGKTTLARTVARTEARRLPVTYFDLEDPTDLARFDAPKTLLDSLEGLVVIDEVQRVPELFPLLRVLADRPLPKKKRTRFLILGSASRDMIRQSSETLAGRIRYVEMTPFSLQEVGVSQARRLWVRGGFPPSFLSASNEASAQWRRSFVTDYLERDIPALGIQIPPRSLRRFWMMLAHYHGQVFNASEIGRSLGLSDVTVRRYLDILSGTFMVRELPAWVENIGKRQVKSPKIYFRDTGIFHTLLGLVGEQDVLRHPKLGASWEGFALEEVIRREGASPEEAYFWSTHGEAELDLLLLKNGKRVGFEFKFSDAPRVSKSMRLAMQDLRLDRLTVVHPGRQSYPLSEGIEARGLTFGGGKG